VTLAVTPQGVVCDLAKGLILGDRPAGNGLGSGVIRESALRFAT
jgi:hypothetical protein